MQYGRNNGITGLVDINGSEKFHVEVTAFDQVLGVAEKNRDGPGTGKWSIARALRPGGQLVLRGLVKHAGYPMPTLFKGQEGSIVLTFDEGKTQTCLVRITQAKVTFSEKEVDVWRIALTATITANPTFAGFGGSQPAATDPTATDQELYAGRSKQLDPDGLQTGGANTYDIWPMLTTHAGEAAELAAIIVAASPPFPTCKVRTAKLEPNRDDEGGTLVVEFALTTTAEDIENQGTWQNIDPLGIDSSAQVTDVHTYGVLPADPTPVAGLQITGERLQELNDGKQQTTWHEEVLNSRQKRTYPRIRTHDDPLNLADDAVRAEFWTVGDTPPALPTDTPTNNVKLVGFTDVPITPTQNLRVWLYGTKTTGDEATIPHTRTTIDTGEMNGSGLTAWLDGDTPPAAPEDLVARELHVRALTMPGGGGFIARSLYVQEYGVRSTQQDITMPGTYTRTDEDDVDNEAQQTVIYRTIAGDDATDLTPPANTEVVSDLVRELNALNSTRVVKWGARNAKHEIEWLRSKRTHEAGMLKPFALVCEVTSSITPDASADNPDSTNLSLHSSEVFRLNTGQYVHLHEFRPLTETEAGEADGTHTDTDPGAEPLIGDAASRQYTSTTVMPTAVTIAGRVVTRWRVVRVGKERFRHDFTYDFRTNAAKLEAARTRTLIDAGGLRDTATTADVWLVSVGAPLLPSAPAGLKIVDREDLETDNPLLRIRVYSWGKQTSKDVIEDGDTVTHTDPDGLESWQHKTLVNATPSVDGGFTLVDTAVQPLNDTDTKTRVRGELVGNAARIEYDGSNYDLSLTEAASTRTTTVVTTTDSLATQAATLATANAGDPTFLHAIVQKLNANKSRQTVFRLNDHLILTVRTSSGFHTTYGAISGGVVKCRVGQIIQRGTSLWSARVVPQTFNSVRARFELKRRIDGTTLNLAFAEAGLTNNATIYGLLVGLVKYEGRQILPVDLRRTGRVADVVDIFDYDELGHFSTGGIHGGWAQTSNDLSAFAPGDLIPATTLDFGGTAVAGQVDLSAFFT